MSLMQYFICGILDFRKKFTKFSSVGHLWADSIWVSLEGRGVMRTWEFWVEDYRGIQSRFGQFDH